MNLTRDSFGSDNKNLNLHLCGTLITSTSKKSTPLGGKAMHYQINFITNKHH